MLRKYLIQTLRSILLHKTTSLIHIIGLSLSMAAFILIMQFVYFELNYESFYKNVSEIYRITQERYEKGKLVNHWAAGCPAIGPALKKEFPELTHFARLCKIPGIITIENQKFREEKLFFADTEFLQMFPVELIAGNDTIALDEPYTAAISQSMANKYYGGKDALGKTFKLGNNALFRITGIFRDVPSNTHLSYNILASWPTWSSWRGPDYENAWFFDGVLTYILLPKNTEMESFQKKMNSMVEKSIEDASRQYGLGIKFYLQPIKNIHLQSNLKSEPESNGRADTVYFAVVIAFLILIIAWVNYFNLSLVKSISRSTEVAIRKINGAFRRQVIQQLVLDSAVVHIISVLIALFIVEQSIPLLKFLTGKNYSHNLGFSSILILGFITLGPIISGLYPAILVTSIKPLELFQGKIIKGHQGIFLRKSLMVLQFAISVALITGTVTIYKQIQYMQSKELGVNIEQVLVIRGAEIADSTYDQKILAFKEELLRYPFIEKMAASSDIPGNKISWNAGGIRLAKNSDEYGEQYRILGIDYDFLDLYNLSCVAGRNFSRDFNDNWNSVLFTESAARQMQFESPEKAIGEEIYFWGRNYRIIGIVKDFHQESIKENYDAIIFRFTPGTRNYYSIKMDLPVNFQLHSNISDLSPVKIISNVWDKFFPDNPFEYFLLKDHYNSQYVPEKKITSVFGVFSSLAIVISCLGLFGLCWYTGIQQRKETGIRKVAGASVREIYILTTSRFLSWVGIGILIAGPAIYPIITGWLQKYPVRIDFSWWYFALASILVIAISFISIAYNISAISRLNPVVSLKYE